MVGKGCAVPNPELRLRLDPEARAALDDLARDLGLNQSATVRLAIMQLHRAQRLQVAAPTSEDVAQQRRSPGRRGPRPSRIAQREQAARESGSSSGEG